MTNEVKIKDGEIMKLEAQIRRKLEQTINNKSLLVEIGQHVIKGIKGEARLGKGFPFVGPSPEGGDRAERLLPIKKSTVEQRKRISSRNQIGVLFKPEKSNLTLTGKLLESLSFVVSNSKPLIQITADGDHPGYIQKNGKRTKSAPFKDIFKWQIMAGRNIFGISKQTYKTVANMVKAHIRRSLK